MVQMKEDFFDTKFPMARLSGKSRVFKSLGIYIFHKSHSCCFSSCTWVKYSLQKAVMGISYDADKTYYLENNEYVILYIWLTMNINI